MAKRFKQQPITEPGIYEIRLHDDCGFVEKRVIEVTKPFSDSSLDYRDGDNLAPVTSLESEYIIYQRKIGELLYPLTWRTSEEFEQIKQQYPQYRNKTHDNASPPK